MEDKDLVSMNRKTMRDITKYLVQKKKITKTRDIILHMAKMGFIPCDRRTIIKYKRLYLET